MSALKRKLPLIDAESGFFWTLGSSGKLHIQRCGHCGHWQHPPQPACTQCHGDNLSPQPVSGYGVVATFTINHEPWHPAMKEPFCFAAIALDEQLELYVFSNVQAPVDSIHIGQRVQVFFEQHDDIFLPLFAPVKAHD